MLTSLKTCGHDYATRQCAKYSQNQCSTSFIKHTCHTRSMNFVDKLNLVYRIKYCNFAAQNKNKVKTE